MPGANTSWTGPQVAKSLVIPCAAKPRGQSPEILAPHMPGSWGRTDPYLQWDLNTYPVHKPSNQQGQHLRPAPAHPHQQGSGHPEPQARESQPQPTKLGPVDVLIHFSQTNGNVMRNWCRPVAQPSPSWRRLVGFWGPCLDCIYRKFFISVAFSLC